MPTAAVEAAAEYVPARPRKQARIRIQHNPEIFRVDAHAVVRPTAAPAALATPSSRLVRRNRDVRSLSASVARHRHGHGPVLGPPRPFTDCTIAVERCGSLTKLACGDRRWAAVLLVAPTAAADLRSLGGFLGLRPFGQCPAGSRRTAANRRAQPSAALVIPDRAADRSDAGYASRSRKRAERACATSRRRAPVGDRSRAPYPFPSRAPHAPRTPRGEGDESFVLMHA